MKRKYSKRKTYNITIDGQNVPNVVFASKVIGVKHITLLKKIERFCVEEDRTFEEIINGQKVLVKLY